jgi:hypothetical protein
VVPYLLTYILVVLVVARVWQGCGKRGKRCERVWCGSVWQGTLELLPKKMPCLLHCEKILHAGSPSLLPFFRRGRERERDRKLTTGRRRMSTKPVASNRRFDREREGEGERMNGRHAGQTTLLLNKVKMYRDKSQYRTRKPVNLYGHKSTPSGAH